MLRRVVTTLGLVGVLSAVNLSMANPASAEIERCRGPISYVQGITVRVCISVNLSVGEARTRVSYNLPVRTEIDLCTYIHRDADENGRCETRSIGPGAGAIEQARPAVNLAGPQRWFAEFLIVRASYEEPLSDFSPTVIDT